MPVNPSIIGAAVEEPYLCRSRWKGDVLDAPSVATWLFGELPVGGVLVELARP